MNKLITLILCLLILLLILIIIKHKEKFNNYYCTINNLTRQVDYDRRNEYKYICTHQDDTLLRSNVSNNKNKYYIISVFNETNNNPKFLTVENGVLTLTNNYNGSLWELNINPSSLDWLKDEFSIKHIESRKFINNFLKLPTTFFSTYQGKSRYDRLRERTPLFCPLDTPITPGTFSSTSSDPCHINEEINILIDESPFYNDYRCMYGDIYTGSVYNWYVDCYESPNIIEYRNQNTNDIFYKIQLYYTYSCLGISNIDSDIAIIEDAYTYFINDDRPMWKLVHEDDLSEAQTSCSSLDNCDPPCQRGLVNCFNEGEELPCNEISVNNCNTYQDRCTIINNICNTIENTNPSSSTVVEFNCNDISLDNCNNFPNKCIISDNECIEIPNTTQVEINEDYHNPEINELSNLCYTRINPNSAPSDPEVNRYNELCRNNCNNYLCRRPPNNEATDVACRNYLQDDVCL